MCICVKPLEEACRLRCGVVLMFLGTCAPKTGGTRPMGHKKAHMGGSLGVILPLLVPHAPHKRDCNVGAGIICWFG